MEFSKIFSLFKRVFKKSLPLISPDDTRELHLDLCVFIVLLVQLVYSPKTDVFQVELCNVDVSK